MPIQPKTGILTFFLILLNAAFWVAYAIITSAFTVLLMAIIWLPAVLMLSDPTADLANYAIPMILYEPLASFIGWLVLMILISPFLQMLMTLFGAQVTLWLSKSKPAAPGHAPLPDPSHG